MSYTVEKHRPFMSIIIPLHNEQTRIRQSVVQVIRFGEKYLGSQYEILLVENGSTDDTFAIAQELARTYRPIKALQLDQRSKAQAVRHGMLMARGVWRYMCDVDLSVPIDELYRFMRASREGWDIVIGSREHPESHVETSLKRWMIGRVFQLLVLSLTGLHYRDTQCGFKLFNGQAAEKIFSHVQCTSMAFDVEVLYLTDKLGYYCGEIPITWENDPDSRVRLVRDSWAMFKDLVQIRKLHGQAQPEYKTKLPA
jgi:dolichyl-phosphate beta-glucosyltransferase